MKVRLFANADLAAVYAIQLQCPQAAQWHEEDYLHLARVSGGMILVAEAGDPTAVLGYAVFHRVIDEVELRNIAVAPAHQGKGIARALLEEGIRAAQRSGVRRLFLEVRASNLPALALYASAGFQLLYTRHDYYRDPVEDALVMARDIASSSPISQAP
jgi:ribosomal-protein-alanine N-acetyltransferase